MSAETESAVPRETLGWLDRAVWLRRLLILAPTLWLLAFFALPFAITVDISLSESILASPPVRPIFAWPEGAWLPQFHGSLQSYVIVLSDPFYVSAYINSVLFALSATVSCLAIGFPMAYGIATSPPHLRRFLLLLASLPFWISYLIRIYSWMGILGKAGPLNDLLLWLGVIAQPVQFLYTPFAVWVGITYTYLPFLVLPIVANLEKLEPSLREAASDLGAKPREVFCDVTLPLALPGVVAGCLLVFIPAVGEYVIPSLLGGKQITMIGPLLYAEFFSNQDWPLAAAMAVLMLLVLLVPILVFHRLQARELM